MKNFKKLINYTLYVLLTVFIFSCRSEITITKKDDIKKYNILIIDGCEYIYDRVVGKRSLVHKGNCKNKIHKNTLLYNTKLKNKIMEKKYKVITLINNTYQVVDKETFEVFFQGSLSDCDAYINLKTKNYF